MPVSGWTTRVMTRGCSWMSCGDPNQRFVRGALLGAALFSFIVSPALPRTSVGRVAGGGQREARGGFGLNSGEFFGVADVVEARDAGVLHAEGQHAVDHAVQAQDESGV